MLYLGHIAKIVDLAVDRFVPLVGVFIYVGSSDYLKIDTEFLECFSLRTDARKEFDNLEHLGTLLPFILCYLNPIFVDG